MIYISANAKFWAFWGLKRIVTLEVVVCGVLPVTSLSGSGNRRVAALGEAGNVILELLTKGSSIQKPFSAITGVYLLLIVYSFPQQTGQLLQAHPWGGIVASHHPGIPPPRALSHNTGIRPQSMWEGGRAPTRGCS